MATMSERVKKLVGLGLLRKSQALDNRKEILITLTDRGRLVYEGHAAMHRKMFQFFADHYGDRTCEKLAFFSQAFNEYLALAQSIREAGKEGA